MRRIFSSILVAYILFIPTLQANECVITGCNQELCSEMAHPHVGICLWKPEYACYHQYGVCEKDSNGVCNWTQTIELAECLQKIQQEQEGTVIY